MYGEPGNGKSHFAKSLAAESDIYYKSQNKWWDGYTSQTVVIIEDMDSDCLNHLLKIWTDKYSAYGEVKGGTVPLNYEKLVITSNFRIDTLFDKLPAVTR